MEGSRESSYSNRRVLADGRIAILEGGEIVVYEPGKEPVQSEVSSTHSPLLKVSWKINGEIEGEMPVEAIARLGLLNGHASQNSVSEPAGEPGYSHIQTSYIQPTYPIMSVGDNYDEEAPVPVQQKTSTATPIRPQRSPIEEYEREKRRRQVEEDQENFRPWKKTFVPAIVGGVAVVAALMLGPAIHSGDAGEETAKDCLTKGFFDCGIPQYVANDGKYMFDYVPGSK